MNNPDVITLLVTPKGIVPGAFVRPDGWWIGPVIAGLENPVSEDTLARETQVIVNAINNHGISAPAWSLLPSDVEPLTVAVKKEV
jgi:hypothetical protein